jgi:hypothetical protein
MVESLVEVVVVALFNALEQPSSVRQRTLVGKTINTVEIPLL